MVHQNNDSDEDPFFNALLHNNDEDGRVVKNAVNKDSEEPADEEMFVKLSRKLFHYPHGDDQTKPEDQDRVTFGLREFIQDGSFE